MTMSVEDVYIPRYVDGTLDALLAELPALMLTGPRGCGKINHRVAQGGVRDAPGPPR